MPRPNFTYRLYAPFLKRGRRYVRATHQDGTEMSAYKKETAIRIYQSWLLAGALGYVSESRSLRPIPKEKELS
jgi:hypothetical protein